MAAIPFYLWGRTLGAGVQGVMFFGAVVMAAAAALIYLCLLELGCDRRSGTLGSLVFAFATAAWPYSRSFFREPLTIVAYLLAFYGMFRYRTDGLDGRQIKDSKSANQQIGKSASRQAGTAGNAPSGRVQWLALSGFGLGLALTTKQIGVAIIPSLLLLILVYEWPELAHRVLGAVLRLAGRWRAPRAGAGRDVSIEPASTAAREAEGALPTTASLHTASSPSERETSARVVHATPQAAPSEAGQRRDAWRCRAVGALAFGLPLALILLLNWRYTATTLGGVETFARDVVDFTTDPQLSSSAPARMLRAALGLTISPYKGLFWFSPVLLLGLIGAVPFVRRRPTVGLALLAATGIHLLGYSRYNYWSGGVTWGSRYMLQVTPFLVLLAAPVWAWLASR